MYRIADVSFEKNLVCVTANYTKKDDGHVLVDNSGYNCQTKENSQKLGDAKLRGKATEGKLGVCRQIMILCPYNSGRAG
jgi:apolipoprotein D and lipocalin family protein